jgi:hypothetical protein
MPSGLFIKSRRRIVRGVEDADMTDLQTRRTTACPPIQLRHRRHDQSHNGGGGLPSWAQRWRMWSRCRRSSIEGLAAAIGEEAVEEARALL